VRDVARLYGLTTRTVAGFLFLKMKMQNIVDVAANKPRIAARPSGSAIKGFYRYKSRDGERPDDGAPFTPTTTIPKYNGSPSGRAPTGDEKLGAWQLQVEYLEGRLGKNPEENSRHWNTIKWIDKHFRVVRTPAEALPPLNIYIGDKISQTTAIMTPTGPDDEAPDEAANEGIEFESISVCQTDKSGNTKVMDEDGTTHRLDIKTIDYDLLRLIDALEEIDKPAKIDVNVPLLPQIDFPSSDQRAESGKIIRMLILGMRSLWHPVERAIADHASMKPLGKTQGVGDHVAAAVGRQRVIEGLRLAVSIRKSLAKQERGFSMWQSQIDARQISIPLSGIATSQKMASVDGIIGEVLAALPMAVRAPEGHYWNQAAGPVIKLPDAANGNWEAEASIAA
jgi:hypothetical protein